MDQASSIKIVNAAVGILQQQSGEVLLAERPVGKPWPGYWEFPGGKIETGETPEVALIRELQEELGVTCQKMRPWLTRTFDYPEHYDEDGKLTSAAKRVSLHFFIVTQWQGEPVGLEQQKLCWQVPAGLTVSPMLPANAPIIEALQTLNQA